MATAIYLEGVRQATLRNVMVRGFDIALLAKNSNFIAEDFYSIGNFVGVYAKNSIGTIHRGYFRDNAIDIVVNTSSIHVIDTVAKRILEIARNYYRYEFIELGYIASRIINTLDLARKRELYRKLFLKIRKFARNPVLRDILISVLSEILSYLILRYIFCV